MHIGRTVIDQGNKKANIGKVHWIGYSFINYLYFTKSEDKNKNCGSLD